MMVASVLAVVIEAHNESGLCRWQGKCYVGGEQLVGEALAGVDTDISKGAANNE